MRLSLQNLNELSRKMRLVSVKRKQNGANIKTDTVSMLKHCATEVVETMEAYTKYEKELSYNDYPTSEAYKLKEKFSSELADIICCALIASDIEGVDIEGALTECYEKNLARSELRGDKL